MITKKFFKEQLTKLQTCYGKDKFDLTKEMFDLWYDMFSDCDEDGLKLAVANCIKDSEFAPNIAGLMKYYKALERDREEITAVMKQRYATMLYTWGEKFDADTFKAIIDYIFQFPKDKRKEQMIELTHNAVSFYNDCRDSGRQDIPTIKEYVEGKR